MSQSKTERSSEHPMYDWSNPRRVGPGAWYMFMLMACQNKDKAERAWVCTQIRLFCDYFKCGDCSGHCHKYISENPPEEFLEEEYGLFDWVVRFMNAVNRRLGRPLYDRDILLRTFTQQEFKFCEAGCGQKDAAVIPLVSRRPMKVDSGLHSKEIQQHRITQPSRLPERTQHSYRVVGRDDRYSSRPVYPQTRGGRGSFSPSARQFF